MASIKRMMTAGQSEEVVGNLERGWLMLYIFLRKKKQIFALWLWNHEVLIFTPMKTRNEPC
jgi:hypothetical protein